MASTVITAPELHERDDEYVREKLTRWVPNFRINMDQAAGNLIGNLESILKHRLWARIGFASFADYAEQCLEHSEHWCHEAIRIYRQDWDAEKQNGGSVSELSEHVERNRQIREALAEGAKQKEVAAEHGISQQRVSQLKDTRDAPSKPRDRTRVQIYPGTDPKAAAKRIIDKLGPDFAEALKAAL